jgi:hypothetical protein
MSAARPISLNMTRRVTLGQEKVRPPPKTHMGRPELGFGFQMLSLYEDFLARLTRSYADTDQNMKNYYNYWYTMDIYMGSGK